MRNFVCIISVWTILTIFPCDISSFPLRMNDTEVVPKFDQRQTLRNNHRELPGKDFTAHRSNLMPLYQKVIDPGKCYIQQWKYLKDNKREFYGEPGSDSARQGLLASGGRIIETSEEFFRGLANLNHNPHLILRQESFIAIDVGANIGQGVEFIKQILPRPNCDSFFFEPNPVNWPKLKERLQNIPNSKLVTLACGQSMGTMIFDASEKNNTSGNQHGQLLLSMEDSLNTMTVDVVPLDYYFSTEELTDRPVLYLKTDAEGFDGIILRGAKSLLSRTRFVLFECHLLMKDGKFRGPGITHYEIMQLFSSLGFDVFKLSPQQWVLFSEDFYNEILDDPKFMSWQNCIAIHRTDPIITDVFTSHNVIPWCNIDLNKIKNK